MASSFPKVCLFDLPVFSRKHFDVILQLLFTIKGRNFRVWLLSLPGFRTETQRVLSLSTAQRTHSKGLWEELGGRHLAAEGLIAGGGEGNRVQREQCRGLGTFRQGL